MDKAYKKEQYDKSQKHVNLVSSHILKHKEFIEISIKNLRETLRKGDLEDPEVLQAFIVHRLETKQQLEYSHKTPYFVRCDVLFDDEKNAKILYFGRFQFIKDKIYSWITPAASIRFETPGKFTYLLPDGNKKSGTLLRKDQFMIVNKRIIFLSSEATTYQRELIYQEYFSQRKIGFVLPEIVEQMEKAQDKIIRADYKGSFLISGAAGSGKTTLALHRVAYLVQSPETDNLFKPENIIVFVQDTATKQYFNGLLPELGIYRVKITTFDEWAINILGISDMKFVRRCGKTEADKDEFEYNKNIALRAFNAHIKSSKAQDILEKSYRKFLTDSQMNLFNKQINEKLLDRFDLALLLKNELLKNGVLIETVEKYVKQKSTGKYIKKIIKQPVNYSLIVLDEAENYLSDQIAIIKTCINTNTNALIYVGDLIQRTLLWTIRDWKTVDEYFEEERKVELNKVYRNTKQILEYVKSLNYGIEIPKNLKNGDRVIEKTFTDKSEETMHIVGKVKNSKSNLIGILAKSDEYLRDYKKALSGYKNVHILTINEAQGVEFDSVFLVGINKEIFSLTADQEIEILNERVKVNNDLLYVALTRAMNNLYISGKNTLREILQLS